MQTFWGVFIPLFVAIDVFGAVLIFIGMMGGMEKTRRAKVTFRALLTALGVCRPCSSWPGTSIFRLLGHHGRRLPHRRRAGAPGVGHRRPAFLPENPTGPKATPPGSCPWEPRSSSAPPP
jgi:hypothetical protein